MQAQLQGWDVTPGHGGLRGWSRSAAADVKDRQRGEAGQGFGTVCPVSAAIRLPTWLPRPGDRDLSDTRRSAAETAGSPELRQRPAVQLTGRSVPGSASLRSSWSYRPSRRHQADKSAALFAASTQPQFTIQAFDGSFRRPIALFVLTWSSTMACSRCSTSMNWAWWLPGTPPMPAAAGLL